MLWPEKLRNIETLPDKAGEYLRFVGGGRRLVLSSAIELAVSHGISVIPKTKADLQGKRWEHISNHIPAWSNLLVREIYYRTDMSERRQRISILHEIYHHLRPPPPELSYPESWLPPDVTEDLGDRYIVTKWQQSQSGKVASYEKEADAYARTRALQRGIFTVDICHMSLRECLSRYDVEVDCCVKRIIDVVPEGITGLIYTCRPEPDGAYVTSQKKQPLMILPWRMGPGLKSLTTYVFLKHRFQFPAAGRGQLFEGTERASANGEHFVIHWIHLPIKFTIAGQLVVLVGQADVVRNYCKGVFRGY